MRIISLVWLLAITTGLIAIDIHLGAIQKLDTEISNSLAMVNASMGNDSGD
jgi:hypothetical protein